MAIKEASEDAVLVWTEHFLVFDIRVLVIILNVAQSKYRERDRKRVQMEKSECTRYRSIVDWGRYHEFECMENSVINGTVLDKRDDLEHSTCSLSSQKEGYVQYATEQLNTPTMRRQSHGQHTPTRTPMHFSCWLLLLMGSRDSC